MTLMNKDYSGHGHEITAIGVLRLSILFVITAKPSGCTEQVQRNTMKLLMYLINLPTNQFNKH